MKPGDRVCIHFRTGNITPFVWHGIIRDGGVFGLCIEWEYGNQTVATFDWGPEIWRHIQAEPC